METLMKRNSAHLMGPMSLTSGEPLSLRANSRYAHSMSGGAGGSGIRISRSTSYGGQLSSGGGSYDYQFPGANSGSFTIFNMINGNAALSICCDNAHLAAEDFKIKLDYEMGMRQAVEADVARMRKMLDDTNMTSLHLEGDIESLKEELIKLTKYHKTDLAELRSHIGGRVEVDVDAPKGQDLTKIMEEMRDKYERVALKNQEEVKAWHDSQITVVQVEVAQNTTALKEANSCLSETRRRLQTMEIELQSILALKASLEATLREVEMRYNMEIEKYNEIILRLQAELTRLRDDTQQVKESSKTVQTKVVTVTQTLVDGKVVSESKDVQASEKVVSA
ncbi:hypothetical protein NHX12_012209 [Muraenolepis orangiensis]|uniref:IF rod domain-containing protein n=1 Tax=Muraenolepis orangiensis TaxID=630683 RepID=A0A9Q0DF04_9TELE|nr:hypothetical protein NHX12_012209 [Muraenolepis orangiensis]